jgi:formylglycine-generating enzyme required for sulfatase activity
MTIRTKGLLAAAIVLALSWGTDSRAQNPPVLHQAPGEVFNDCAYCPPMVVVPAGTFLMGTPDSEYGHGTDEGPQHSVTIRSFAIGRSHVTRGQFAAFVGATHYPSSGGCDAWQIHRRPEWQLDPQRNWSSPGWTQNDRHPVVCVSWNDARAYVRWLSSQTGHAYRLPSEAEWEYAARAGTTTARFWGEGPEETCTYAQVSNYLAEAEIIRNLMPRDRLHRCATRYEYTAPVMSFRPNQFGLYDMLGNAVQWVEDCSHDYDGVPADESAWTTGDCTRHLGRGSSFAYPPVWVRVGQRIFDPTDHRGILVGFRVAMTLAAAQ